MSKDKMTTAQPISGEVSLDDFITGADPVVKAQDEPAQPTAMSNEITGRVGRPSIPASEVRNKSLQIKLTENEYNALKDEAGMVPLSTYVREKMKTNKVI